MYNKGQAQKVSLFLNSPSMKCLVIHWLTIIKQNRANQLLSFPPHVHYSDERIALPSWNFQACQED